MAGRVEEDTERRAGLVLVLGGAELEDRSLRDVKVVHGDVQVHLLGLFLARVLAG